MVCQKCKYVMDAFDKECPRCHGKGLAPPPPEEEQPKNPVKQQAAILQNAKTALHPTPDDKINIYETYAGSVVGKWSSAFVDCDKDGALKIGLFCAAIFVICIVTGANLAIHKIYEMESTFMQSWPFAAPTNAPGAGNGLTTHQTFKLILVALVPFISISISSVLVRKLFSDRDDGCFSNDIFVAGVSLLPLGIFALLSNYLGLANLEVTVILSVFVLSYTIILLYNGCTIIARIKNTAATIAVPTMLLLSAWITKIILTKMIHM